MMRENMIKRMKRRFIKEKEAKRLLLEFRETMSLSASQLPTLKPPLELADDSEGEIFYSGGSPVIVRLDKRLFPTLGSRVILSHIPKVVVNLGAIPHVCNGADIMSPGIVKFEGMFKKGDIVVITDEQYGKPIAVAEALYNLEVAKTLKRGKLFKNLHYVGDKIWQKIKPQ